MNLCLSLVIATNLITSVIIAAVPAEMALVVEAAVVKEQPFEFSKRYVGKITTEYFSFLKPPVSGTIDEINIKADQKVKKNQRLFSLDNSSHKAALELAKKNFNLAQKALGRAKLLLKTHDVSKVHVEEIEKARLDAEQKLLDSKKALQNSEIEAPFEGFVGVPRVVLGQSVTPEDILVSIRKGSYIVTIQVPPSGLKELALGQIVIVNKERSTIDAIERSIDPKTRTGFATVKLKECPKCIIGSSVYVDIIIENNAHAVMINRNAIFYEKKQSYVVVIKKDSDGTQRAEYRKVSVGKEQDGLVHVVDGITPGELIVTANPKRLRPQVLLRVHS